MEETFLVRVVVVSIVVGGGAGSGHDRNLE
jgi:hypothetical protein